MQPKYDDVKDALQNALRLMRDSGFSVSGKVEVVVDPDLPFMGYSTQRAEGNLVVVAGRAVESGMIEGLLIHELCHIYRTEQNHPSHNRELLNRAGYHFLHEHELSKDYQVKTVQQAINHIQDLYADDISFQVFRKSQIFTEEQAHAFFLDWINEEPVEGKGVRARWLNVEVLLNNCFAISNMQRHKVKDIRNQAETRVQKFLSKVNESMRKEFIYFRDFMTGLKEDVAKAEFENSLNEYLIRIVKLVTETQRQN